MIVELHSHEELRRFLDGYLVPRETTASSSSSSSERGVRDGAHDAGRATTRTAGLRKCKMIRFAYKLRPREILAEAERLRRVEVEQICFEFSGPKGAFKGSGVNDEILDRVVCPWVIANSSLTHLDLTSNNLTDTGFRRLADAVSRSPWGRLVYLGAGVESAAAPATARRLRDALRLNSMRTKIRSNVLPLCFAARRPRSAPSRAEVSEERDEDRLPARKKRRREEAEEIVACEEQQRPPARLQVELLQGIASFMMPVKFVAS